MINIKLTNKSNPIEDFEIIEYHRTLLFLSELTKIDSTMDVHISSEFTYIYSNFREDIKQFIDTQNEIYKQLLTYGTV
jgi:hypothetical protein